MTQDTALAESSGVITSTNPLVVIGWSHSILELKLSEDEYHKLAIKQAQFLAAIKHEDRTKNSAVSMHFNEAHATIKNKAEFLDALNELRADRNIQRRTEAQEIVKLSKQLSSVTKELETIKNSDTVEQQGVIKLAEVNTNLTKYISSIGLDLYGYRDGKQTVIVSSVSKVQTLDVLTLRFDGSQHFVRKHEPLLHQSSQFELMEYERLRTLNLVTSSNAVGGTEWRTMVDFISRFVAAGRQLVLEVKRFKVEDGVIEDGFSDIAKMKIFGSVASNKFQKPHVRAGRIMKVTFPSIAHALNPYMLINRFLVADIRPTVLQRDDFTKKGFIGEIDQHLDKKASTFHNSAYKSIPTSKLGVIGIILAINNEDPLLRH